MGLNYGQDVIKKELLRCLDSGNRSFCDDARERIQALQNMWEDDVEAAKQQGTPAPVVKLTGMWAANCTLHSFSPAT